MPEEYLPNLLQIIRLFRESVALKPAEASFRKGWREALAGETMPVSELWALIPSEPTEQVHIVFGENKKAYRRIECLY